jgi:hypothetical protein
MTGTLAISGLLKANLTNFYIAYLPSINPSSRLISNICAPSSTYCLATAAAFS